jgi:prepilin-type N-terminal cleavage/methylation domain-containing protein
MQHYARKHASRGFTLLEVVIVMFIVALVMAGVHSIAHGTLTLADDVRRAQRHEARKQAFVHFSRQLFASLSPGSALNLKTVQDGGHYLSSLEVRAVSSPFDGTPGRIVALFTETAVGGGLRLLMEVRSNDHDSNNGIKVLLFEDIATCEWRACDPATAGWLPSWTEPVEEQAMHRHPQLLELNLATVGGISDRFVCGLPQTAPFPPPTATPQ